MEGQNVNNVSALQIFDTFGGDSRSLNLYCGLGRPLKTFLLAETAQEGTKSEDWIEK